MAAFIANDNQRAEAQVFPAFDDLRHTVDGHDRVFQLQL